MEKRKWYFRLLKKITRGRYKKVQFIYKGEEISEQAIVLCNHEGTDGPMSWEMYSNKPIRFWGAHEMNSGLRKMYKYQTEVYYHQKKHWNLFLAKMFCLLASPLTNLFYKGLNLISTYPDLRFYKTITESVNSVKKGYNIVIFPEKSTEGYQDELLGFYCGFISLATALKNEGIDSPIYVSYLNKKKHICLVDSPRYIDDLLKQFDNNKEEVAAYLCEICNELGREIKATDYDKKGK